MTESPAPISPAPVDAIAIIGMAGAFPGSPDLDAFWQRTLAGHDAGSSP